ncbi:MAG TPA: M24 family metallopeptidase [Actinomycetota bacterium]|nr:M24 family metallopeptidase [Actinomycetota bacterium]
MARRHGDLRRAMAEQDVAAVLVGGATGPIETSVQYYTNWPPLVESYVLLPFDGEPVLFVRLWNHLPDARRIAVIDDVRYGGDTPDEQARQLAEVLRERGLGERRIGLVGPIRHGDVQILRAALPGAEWVDLGRVYRELRLVKSDEELRFTRIAAAMIDRSVEAMERQIKPGLREYELAKIIEDAYLAERGTNLIHFTLTTSMADPQACVPHQYAPDRVIQSGDVIVTEISASFWGYAGQILRSFTVDADPAPLYQELYDVAVAVYDDIVALLRPGATVGQILDRADRIHDAGLTIYDDLVHGFGGAYLPPIIRTRKTRGATHGDDYAYPAGAIVVVQPNVITPDEKAGVQVGNAVHITPEGPEVLQRYPMKFIRCG